MVFNVTFNNISVISWRPVLLVEETWSTRREPPTCLSQVTDIYHIMLYLTLIREKYIVEAFLN